VRVNNDGLAVINEKRRREMTNEDRPFDLEPPDWSHQNQLFRFGEGGEPDVRVAPEIRISTL
jgi:hypothetical protein